MEISHAFCSKIPHCMLTRQNIKFLFIKFVFCLKVLKIVFQVKNNVGAPDTGNMDDWLIAFSRIIQKSCKSVCFAWLENELGLETNNKVLKKSYDNCMIFCCQLLFFFLRYPFFSPFCQELVSLITEKLNGDDTVLQNIRKSGKENLYAELLYFLRFGSLR